MKNWAIFLVSLLLAFLVWVMHTFSLVYSSYIEYKVTATTDLVGYSPVSTAEETLLIRGRASGFYIMQSKNHKKAPYTLELAIEPSLFIPSEDEEGTFTVDVQTIKEIIEDALAEHVELDYISSHTLTFKFVAQTYRKVPVQAVTELRCKPQYMQVGDILLEPDSVYIYGPVNEIGTVSQVNTNLISYSSLGKSAQGYVALDQYTDIRISEEKVHYSIKVDRFIEQTETFTVSAVNVPKGMSLMILPPQVDVTWRIPFSSKRKIDPESMSLTVDYKDVASSVSAKVIPVLQHEGQTLYSYSFSPAVVECVQVED